MLSKKGQNCKKQNRNKTKTKTKGNWQLVTGKLGTLLLVNTLSQKSTNIKNFIAREAAFQFFSSCVCARKNKKTLTVPFRYLTSLSISLMAHNDHAHNTSNAKSNKMTTGSRQSGVQVPHGAIASPAAPPGDV